MLVFRKVPNKGEKILMTEKITRTVEFLRQKLLIDCNKNCSKEHMAYRYEHSLRVAKHGQTIARAENFDEEALVVACLLHDVGYCLLDEKDSGDYHGWKSEKVSREFVKSLGFDEKTARDILTGIAAHDTGETEFPCEKNVFTESVADCDNIDRFDAFRLYDTLHHENFRDKSIEDQKQTVNRRLARLNQLRDIECATQTAKNLWSDMLDFQILFYARLSAQLNAALD